MPSGIPPDLAAYKVWHGETFAGFAGVFLVLLGGRRELEPTRRDIAQLRLTG